MTPELRAHGRPRLSRRRFLVAAGAFAAVGFGGYTQSIFGTAEEAGRLRIPVGPSSSTGAVGLQKLGGDNGLLYVPQGYRPSEPLPLLILLHRSQGRPAEWFSGGRLGAPDSYSHYSDAGRFIILAPKAVSNTWDGGPKEWGHDYANINAALAAAFARCSIDRNRLAIGGFSDGASYALSLGLANGDLIRSIVAFSPGYIVRSIGRGRPAIFVSHGTFDEVLPIDVSSRAFVASLRKNGYTVTFQEFAGSHTIPPAVAAQAMAWLTASFAHR